MSAVAAPVRRDLVAERELTETVTRRVTIGLLIAHAVGALDVFALLWWVLPLPPHSEYPGAVLVNVLAFVFCLAAGGVIGTVLGRRLAQRGRRWLLEGRQPTEDEQRVILREPMISTAINAALWTAAALLFAAINLPASAELAFHVGSTILLGGVTVCALGYLLFERLMRPLTALALSYGPPPGGACLGVQWRLVLAWLAASGVPLLGLVMLAVHILVTGGVSPQRAATAMLAVSGLALAVGLLMAWAAARSVAEPVSAVRDAMARVERGDLGAEVQVDDSSEVGLLQSGFNRMAGGLREREHLRDLFGRHVGEDVARAALEAGEVKMGGEVRHVAVLFVDLIGSTALAGSRPPEEVVELLNRFFALVVEVVDAHGGWVNKFEGDGALCVFGAPAAHPQPAAAALAAARDLRARLVSELPELPAAIGLSAGPAVAGNVGSERRLEYTVIGDPVNEAARLCDLAKSRPDRVLASEAILAAAGVTEAERWRLGESAVLRGRSSATRVAFPT